MQVVRSYHEAVAEKTPAPKKKKYPLLVLMLMSVPLSPYAG